MLKLSGWSCLNSGRNESQGDGLRAPPSLVGRAVGPQATRRHVFRRKPTNRAALRLAHRLFCSRPAVASGTARSVCFHEGSGREGSTDAEADMPLTEASGAICVQRLDDSRNSAIHIKYRISLRSSSLREPRYPLLRVV